MHSVKLEDQQKRIVRVTLADPYDFRKESDEIMEELNTLLGDLGETVYLIYDVRNLSISFSDLITGATGFAHQTTPFEKQLKECSRLILVGSSSILKVGSRTLQKFSPDHSIPLFDTPEEALAHVRAEFAKQK